MADLDSTKVRLRTSDIREWIFEAIDKIGAPMQYISRESGVDDVPVLKILDHQVPLPPDMTILDGVAYSESPDGPWLPMKTSTSMIKEPMLRPHKHSKVHVPPVHKLPTTLSQVYTRDADRYARRQLCMDHKRELEYFIKPGWLVVNRPHGYIKLIYKAIAVDERGYPLIPDLTSYQEAVYWYVVMKLTFPKFMSGELGGNSKYSLKYAANAYFYTQQLWNFYRNQAYAEAMMPTADDMENIKNDWNKLVPDWDARETFFKDIGTEQSIYTDYYYGY